MKGHKCDQCGTSWRCNERECNLSDHVLCDTCFIHQQRQQKFTASIESRPRGRPRKGIIDTIETKPIQTSDDHQLTTG